VNSDRGSANYTDFEKQPASVQLQQNERIRRSLDDQKKSWQKAKHAVRMLFIKLTR
jgi:hypothetical protein